MQLAQVAVLLALVTAAAALQRWAEQPASTFVNPGGAVTLACRIENKKGDCRWEQKKEDGSVQPLGFYPGKREWAGEVAAGDCSLRILEADSSYDTGRYVCQVTASGFRETDTLISREAVLSVRVPPRGVLIRRPGEAAQVEAVLPGAAGEVLELECAAAGGSPQPSLHWWVGDRRLEAAEVTELRGETVSRLRFTATRQHEAEQVRCVVEHSALATNMEAAARLDIQYPPEVSVAPGQLHTSVLEGGSVNLSCEVAANPPAVVSWRHLNTGQVVAHSAHLVLASVSRARAGSFVCEATNSLATSQSSEAVIDVKYGATVVSVDPQGGVDRAYGSRDTELRCRGDANPPPQYRWVRQSAAGAVTLGHEAALRLGELRYEDQGEYYCEVTNQIASSRSEAVVVTVHGPPRVNNDNKHLFLIEGADATIEVEFCGAPLPKQTWQIESVESRVSLVAGTSHDMFAVDKERAAATSNCYISTLHILSIDQHHARDYVLRLENEHGEEVHRAHVTVGEEISKQTLIGSLVGVAATFLLVLCLAICWCRRCCRTDKQLKPDPERPL